MAYRKYTEEQTDWIRENYTIGLEACADSPKRRTMAADMILPEFRSKWPNVEVTEGGFRQKCSTLVPEHRGPRKHVEKRELKLVGFSGECPYEFMVIYRLPDSDSWHPVMVENNAQLQRKLHELATTGDRKPSVAAFGRLTIKEPKITYEFE